MKKLYSIFFIITFLFSCCKEKEPEITQKNAFLFYAASANNLESDIWSNIQSVVKNYVPSDEKNIYVYFKKTHGISTLYKINKIGGKTELAVVKEYDKTVNCATGETLDMVMNDVSSQKDVIKITDILLSSHGSSWTPSIYVTGKLSEEIYNPVRNRSITNYSFGQDYLKSNETINIDVLAKVLEKYDLTSIIFDACNMCSIEVVYQLRNCAKYILSSPAEILGYGMYYDKITPYFTAPTTIETIRMMAEENYKFYNAMSGWDQSAVMTVTDCSKLNELATLVKEITTAFGTPQNNSLATPDDMIRYDYIINGVAKDYLQYLNNLLDVAAAPQYKTPLKTAWEKAFPYCYHTKTLFYGWPMDGACGVGGYIYRETNMIQSFNTYYKTLDWAKLVMGL